MINELLNRRGLLMGSGSAIDWETYAKAVTQGASSIDVPNGITSLRASFMRTYTGLNYITLPSSLTSIDADAFNSCTSLMNITIPSSVTSIGSNAFNWCSAMQYVIMEGTTPPTLSNSNVFNNTRNCPIYVPDSAVNIYKGANVWSSLASRIFPISDLTT